MMSQVSMSVVAHMIDVFSELLSAFHQQRNSIIVHQKLSQFIKERLVKSPEIIHPVIKYIVIRLYGPHVMLVSVSTNTCSQHSQCVVVQVHPSGMVIEHKEHSASEHSDTRMP